MGPIGRTRYLRQARQYGDLKGLTAALCIMVAWALLLWRGLTMPIQLMPVDTDAPLSGSFSAALLRPAAALLGHVLLTTFFFTGMFIQHTTRCTALWRRTSEH